MWIRVKFNENKRIKNLFINTNYITGFYVGDFKEGDKIIQYITIQTPGSSYELYDHDTLEFDEILKKLCDEVKGELL